MCVKWAERLRWQLLSSAGKLPAQLSQPYASPIIQSSTGLCVKVLSRNFTRSVNTLAGPFSFPPLSFILLFRGRRAVMGGDRGYWLRLRRSSLFAPGDDARRSVRG